MTKAEDWQAQMVQMAASHLNNDATRELRSFKALSGQFDPVPLPLRRKAVSNLGGYQHLGLQFDRAQYLNTKVGVGIWVVPGKGVTCIFQAVKMAAGCTINISAARIGVTLVVGQGKTLPGGKFPPHVLALGIVPDSVRAVRLKPIGGKARVIPVKDNAYAMRASTPINIKGLIR